MSAPSRFRLLVLAIVGGALTVQVGLMVFLGPRAYGDVLKALHFGYLVDIGAYRTTRDVLNSKTFVAPVLDYWIYATFGVAGLRAANLLAFGLLAALALALTRGRFDDETRLLGLFLLAFYVGTQRSIVAGELDDQVTTLLAGAAALVFLRWTSVFAAAVLLGLGLLFKFWIVILAVGFVAFLVVTRRWSRVPVALLGIGLPLALLTLVDDGASVRCFVLSLLEQGRSNWGEVAVKSVTTGLAPATLLAVAGWAEQRRESDTLLLCLALPYPVYVVVTGNAYVATTMMMTCLVFSAPLIATWLLRRASPIAPRARRLGTVALALGYPVAATAVTMLHLHRDTHEVRLIETPADAARMFRFNAPLEPAPPPSLPAGADGA